MSEIVTQPLDFNTRFQVLWEDVKNMSEIIAHLSRQDWIREQELLGLKFEVHALRLRILELEDRNRKELASDQLQS